MFSSASAAPPSWKLKKQTKIKYIRRFVLLCVFENRLFVVCRNSPAIICVKIYILLFMPSTISHRFIFIK
nr:MAG TPA: hypothetical protein [Caudoviricetes sp.]